MRLDGEVLLSRPLRANAVVALLVFVVAGLATWVLTGSYARTESVRGILVTNTESAKIVALRPGVVTRLYVSDGDRVRKGDPLAAVQVDQDYAEGSRATDESLRAVAAQRALATQQIATAELRRRSGRAGLLAVIAGARQQRENLQSQAQIQMQLIASLQAMLDRYAPIADKGYISRTEMDRRGQELLVATQALGRLKQQQASLAADEARATAELRQADVEAATQTNTARLSSEGFRLQEAQLHGQQSYLLTAPTDGVVTALQSGRGRTVDVAVPLMTIVPAGATLRVEAYAPSKAIGFVRLGQEVRLLYDAFPYERFGSFSGRVRAVSKVALDPRQIDAPFRMEEPMYRITVVPDGQVVKGYGENVRLQPGMTLSANIVLERRSFLGWLLEPLTAVSRRNN